jgi:hypothetical protein
VLVLLSITPPFSRPPLLLFFQLFAFVVLVEYDAGGNQLKATENDHREDSDLRKSGELDERRLGGQLREMEMAKICWMCRWTGMMKTSRQLGMSVGVLVPAEERERCCG